MQCVIYIYSEEFYIVLRVNYSVIIFNFYANNGGISLFKTNSGIASWH